MAAPAVSRTAVNDPAVRRAAQERRLQSRLRQQQVEDRRRGTVEENEEEEYDGEVRPDRLKHAAGTMTDVAGRGAQAAGTGMKAGGTAMQAAGAGAQVAGAATQAVGKTAELAGKGAQAVGTGVAAVGKALTATKIGAIIGAPLQALGGGAKLAGKGAEGVGKGTAAVGKGVRSAGKSVSNAGKNVKEAGEKVKEAGGTARQLGQAMKDEALSGPGNASGPSAAIPPGAIGGLSALRSGGPQSAQGGLGAMDKLRLAAGKNLYGNRVRPGEGSAAQRAGLGQRLPNLPNRPTGPNATSQNETPQARQAALQEAQNQSRRALNPRQAAAIQQEAGEEEEEDDNAAASKSALDKEEAKAQSEGAIDRLSTRSQVMYGGVIKALWSIRDLTLWHVIYVIDIMFAVGFVVSVIFGRRVVPEVGGEWVDSRLLKELEPRPLSIAAIKPTKNKAVGALRFALARRAARKAEKNRQKLAKKRLRTIIIMFKVSDFLAMAFYTGMVILFDIAILFIIAGLVEIANGIKSIF